MTFKEIMDYHPRNRTVYSQIIEQYNNLVPYIGAGLSASIMPTWKDALYKLCENITDSKVKEDIALLINSDLFLAASALEEYLGSFIFCDDIVKIFSENTIDAWDNKLLEMSVGQLAALFPKSPVITTNFDRVLEHAYTQCGHPFEYTLGPTSPSSMLANVLQSHSHILYKIHGDIGRKNTDFSTLIFSKEKYEQYYSPQTSLVKHLTNWFKGKSMLFIGCSLEDDYPIRLLQNIVQEDDYLYGLAHFAIVNCKKNDLDIRSRKLGVKHIRTIFYPDGEWDSVNIILKNLYKETILPSIIKTASNFSTAYQTTQNNCFKQKVYDIYIKNPKVDKLAVHYMDTVLNDLVTLREDEQIAKLSEIKKLFEIHKSDLEVQMIYMNALFHCVRSQPNDIAERYLDDMQSLSDFSSFPLIKIMFLHYQILQCKGFYTADELLSELSDLAFDHLNEPYVLEHVIDAQKHVDFLLNG